MQLTLALVHSAILAWIEENKIANNGSFSPSVNEISGLVDKIAKTYTLDGDFSDPLPELDGEDLNYARTLEEYFENLVMPEDNDPTGANALNPAYATYMKPTYSYQQKKQTFKVTRPYDVVQASFHGEGEYADFITLITKRLYDSFNVWKYNVKKKLLGSVISAIVASMSATGAATFTYGTAYNIGQRFTDATIGKAIAVKNIKTTDFTSGDTLQDAIDEGFVVVLNLLSELAVPSDTSSGEAFILDVKKVVEDSKFPSEGNSLNGNTVGVAPAGLKLYIKKGIMPDLEVNTLAGAFHREDVAIPVEIKVVDDLGDDSNDVYAVLVDPRGVKYHSDYIASRSQENAEGDFINFYLHVTPTLAFSRNTFLHAWKKPAGN